MKKTDKNSNGIDKNLDVFESNEPEMQRKREKYIWKKASKSGTDMKTETGVLKLYGLVNER